MFPSRNPRATLSAIAALLAVALPPACARAATEGDAAAETRAPSHRRHFDAEPIPGLWRLDTFVDLGLFHLATMSLPEGRPEEVMRAGPGIGVTGWWRPSAWFGLGLGSQYIYLPVLSDMRDQHDAHRLALLARGAFSIPLRSLESELMFYGGVGPARLWLPAANASGGDWVGELSLGYGRGLGEDSRGFVDLAVCFDESQGGGNPVEACAAGITLRLGAQWK